MVSPLRLVGGTVGPGVPRPDPVVRRRILIVLAVVIAGSVVGIINVILNMELSGRIDYNWIIVLIALDAILVSVVVLRTRTQEHQIGDVQVRLGSRAREQGSTRGGWVLAVFDNGLVMQGQRQGPIVAFYLCYDEGQQRYAPTIAEVQDYMRGFGVMRAIQSVSPTKGDASARALLEQLRTQVGAKRARMVFQKRRAEKRPTVRAPSWIVGVTFFWPKWSQNPDGIVNGLDLIEGFLDSAQKRYFASVMAAG